MLTKALPAVVLASSDEDVAIARVDADRRLVHRRAATCPQPPALKSDWVGGGVGGTRMSNYGGPTAMPSNGIRTRAATPTGPRFSGRPGSASTSPTTWCCIDWTEEAGWENARVRPVRADLARPGDDGAALRPGDLRGPQGVPPAGRDDPVVPPGRERGTLPALVARGWRWPSCPTELFLDSLRALVDIDRAWVPTDPDMSLYLRPFMIATEVGLGVNKGSTRYTYLLIASPAGVVLPAAASSRSRCGSRPSTRARRPAAPARPSARATTRRPSSRRRTPPRRAATRSCGSTRSSTGGSRRWAG